MVNLTPNRLVFNVTGADLSSAIKSALHLAASQSLIASGMEDVDLTTVTTKTGQRATFAKFVDLRVLQSRATQFDENYVERALSAYRQRVGNLSRTDFDLLMAADDLGPLSYRASYAISIKSGLGIFLVALHSSGAITLPATFVWPRLRHEEDGIVRRLEVGKQVSSELLALVRSLDSQSEELPHPAFKAIGGDKKRREWFLTYATKLLLACGWHKPEDVNIEDLLKIKASEAAISGKAEMPLAYNALLDVINLAFPGRVRINSADWQNALKHRLATSAPTKWQGSNIPNILRDSGANHARSDQDLLNEALSFRSAWGSPKRVRTLERLPGIEANVQAMSKVWVALEDLYLRKISRESYKPILGALGWWNVYLFYYLPYWFDRHPETSLSYPSSPALLLKSAFVSRLLEVDSSRPATFVEYMDAQAERRNWKGSGYYGMLLQLEGFFAFIERYSDEMPECAGFKQPLSRHDYPRTSRPYGTKKQPVPRRFFKLYLDYHEALIMHQRVVAARILNDEMCPYDMDVLQKNDTIIDTFATSHSVGFIPVLFTKHKTLPLKYIPNVLNFQLRTIKGGRKVKFPHPHTLHQNLVALYTGLRHNHIQWLDRDKFDSLVDGDSSEFALLYVNTDKQKTKPWTPHVSFRVIELLRAQREWCELIEEPSFHQEHFYNDNPKTKWPKFRPLFSYTSSGIPHSDSRYTNAWQALLCGLQGLMPDLHEYGRGSRLLTLLPPGHFPDDPALKEKLRVYGENFLDGDTFCPLKVASLITPHSARVAVVSQYITLLPTDLIGQHITGQKSGVVSYYVHLDEETLKVEQVRQAARLRAAVLRGAFEPIISGTTSTTALHADNVNSNLASSMKASLEETIISHGGVSISFTEKARRGVDVLRETSGVDVAFNKTEVCPYGNNCPSEIVYELKGLRRCGLCPYAVRFVDHLPAVLAKKRQIADHLDELEQLLSTTSKDGAFKFTPEELDALEDERSRLCEDLSGWTLSEEILEVIRQRIVAGQDTRKWTVQKPEIVERDLRRYTVRTSASEYLLARLGESIAFPMLQSTQVKARLDLLRRELLARSGNLREAFSSSVPGDPAAECAGLVKTIVAFTGMTVAGLAEALEADRHLAGLPQSNLRLLSVEE